ncbi:MAG: hypothetical protein ABSF61_06610 [Anaerolineales bacterium]
MRTDSSPKTRWVNRLLVGDAIGLFLFLFGMQPGLLGLPHRPGFGYFKILVFLTGLAVIALASYAVATLMRREDHAASLFQDVGARLMATGYFLAAFSSIVDLIGLGSERFPMPMHFGYLQSSGLLLGVLIILVGLLAYYPRQKKQR